MDHATLTTALTTDLTTTPTTTYRACGMEPACVAWTTNTVHNNCYLRDAAGPTNPRSECTTGQIRPWTPPAPAPPAPPSSVSVGIACWMGPQYPNGTVGPGCNSTMKCPLGCAATLTPFWTVFRRALCHPRTPRVTGPAC